METSCSRTCMTSTPAAIPSRMQSPSTQTVASTTTPLFFSRASSPPSISWRNPSVPVVNGETVVEKTVFGILSDTRQLWVQLLCGTALRHPAPAPSLVSPAFSPAPCRSAEVVEDREAISVVEAQSFISNVLQRCINLLNINNGRELMTHALGCVEAWLQVR